MQASDMKTLARDVDALLIPTAVAITLPVGSVVQVVQMLGGAITVNINGNLARIEAKDADALGIESENLSKSSPKHEGPLEPVNLELVWEQLKTCYDPEIPVNIVDLGLIYGCKNEELKNEKNELIGNCIHITMTLTAPGCGMGPVLALDVESKARQVPHVTDVKVELVFDPPWSQDRMSEEAKVQLGMFY